MSVNLVKALPPSRHPFHTRQWLATVNLAEALYVIFDDAGVKLYQGLADNDLRSFADTLAYWHRYDNTTGELAER